MGMSSSDGSGREASQRPGSAEAAGSVYLFYWPFWTLLDAVFPAPPPTGPFRILDDESFGCFVFGPLRDD